MGLTIKYHLFVGFATADIVMLADDKMFIGNIEFNQDEDLEDCAKELGLGFYEEEKWMNTYVGLSLHTIQHTDDRLAKVITLKEIAEAVDKVREALSLTWDNVEPQVITLVEFS